MTDRRNDRRRDEYTRCAWAGGIASQFVIERKFIHELHNTMAKDQIKVFLSDKVEVQVRILLRDK
jgi:hypothetical protein